MKFFKNIFFATILLYSALNIFGQTAVRERTFDAQHYIIRSSFDRTKKVYFGDTTIQLKPLKDGFRSLVLGL